MSLKIENKIKCPICGTEYLAAEIFVPKAFVGDAFDITKGEGGKILGFHGNNMNTTEEYICDTCNKPFRVETTLKFTTTEVEDKFNDEYFH